VALSNCGLIKAQALRRRSEEALLNYVGSIDNVKGGIDIACRIAEDAERRKLNGP
jgi:hypothetical protein